jgi:hypothetical protein
MSAIRKSFDSIFSDTSENEKSEMNVLEVIETAIKSLLFYKIEMPAGSNCKSIISSIETIQSKLDDVKNVNIYMVYLL